MWRADSSARCSETLPICSQELEVSHKVLQEAGFNGNEEVQEDAVVEGDALKQQQEVAVRVAARGTGRLQHSKVIQPRTHSAGRNIRESQ